jgi:trimethyllysine dioxygenase
MVDAFAIARRIEADEPELFEVLCSVAVPGQYIGDGAHLMAARPVFRHDHTGRLVQVSFNNSDRAPFLLDEHDMLAFYDAIRVFEEHANDPRLQWRHVLQPGEAMLFDNWRVLHGRAAYQGVRRMCGGYLNREDVESRLRQLL